jgi:hypothetical protein
VTSVLRNRNGTNKKKIKLNSDSGSNEEKLVTVKNVMNG